MKKSLLFFCALLLIVPLYFHTANAQTNNTVVINELSQGDNVGTNDHEWIELAVTANNTDLRGLFITSTSAYEGIAANSFSLPNTTYGIQLDSVSLFNNLNLGDIIVIYKAPTNDTQYDTALGAGTGSGLSPDVSFADGNGILLASNDGNYISGTWPGFKNWNGNSAQSNGDAVGIFTADSQGVFCISYGDGTRAPTSTPITSNYGTATIASTTTLVSGQEIYFNSGTASDANNSSFWVQLLYSSSSPTPKIFNSTANNALPVELTSFSASVNGTSVNLTWKTATEVNNYGFDIERSSDNSGWQKIGFVSGSGNSNSQKEYSFTDKPSGGTSFSYRLKQIDVNGNFKYYDAVTVNLTVSGEPQLLQNSPNPFNPSTTIKFYTPNTSDVTIKIYDMLGREVTTLINQQTTAGYHVVYWNGKDSRGESVASGIYLYRLTAGSFSETKKMNLLK